jgi:hypothetical protein
MTLADSTARALADQPRGVAIQDGPPDESGSLRGRRPGVRRGRRRCASRRCGIEERSWNAVSKGDTSGHWPAEDPPRYRRGRQVRVSSSRRDRKTLRRSTHSTPNMPAITRPSERRFYSSGPTSRCWPAAQRLCPATSHSPPITPGLVRRLSVMPRPRRGEGFGERCGELGPSN